jgi:ACT domain-containing protein
MASADVLDAASALAERDRVSLVALVGRADLNGRDGVVCSALDPSTGRIVVEVEGEANTFALKPQNLQPLRVEPCCSLLSCTTRGVEKLMRCSRCQVARYCSRECQLAHFPQHKGECRRLNSDRLKAELEKSKRKEGKLWKKGFESMLQTRQMLLQRGIGTPAAFESLVSPQHMSPLCADSGLIQEALDLDKRRKAGTLSEQEKTDMKGMQPYQALWQFTAVLSIKGLPNPKSVEDILEQVKDVLPALHQKAIYQKEDNITGFTAGLEDRFASKVRHIEKKVTELKDMDEKSRARLSPADLLSIRQDLQKRVGIIMTEIATDQSDASQTVKDLLDSDNAFKGALAEASGANGSKKLVTKLFAHLHQCKEYRDKLPRDTRIRWTYLHSAAALGLDMAAEVLLRHGTPVNAAEGFHGASPLGVAINADEHNEKLVSRLLDAKADVDYGGWTKRTGNVECPAAICRPPLTCAAQFDNLAGVKMLLRAGVFKCLFITNVKSTFIDMSEPGEASDFSANDVFVSERTN